MNLSQVPCAGVGDPALPVLGWPEEDGGPPVVEAICICLLKRQEGLLLCVPGHFFDEELVASAQTAPASEVLGRSEYFECAAAITTEEGQVEHGARLSVLVIDCSEAICANLSIADVALPLTAEAFQPDDLFPYVPNLLPMVDQWLRGVDRGEFYSLNEGEDPGAAGPKAKAAGKAKEQSKGKGADPSPKEDVRCCLGGAPGDSPSRTSASVVQSPACRDYRSRGASWQRMETRSLP